jgi:hypothetical protein
MVATSQMRSRGLRTLLLGVGLTLFAHAPARACTPWAQRVVAWDAATDLVVVATWKGRERPPASGKLAPDRYELRRMSTGEQVALHLCSGPPPAGGPAGPGSCDWRPIFARWLPEGPSGGRAGEQASGLAVRVRRQVSDAAQEFALEARGKSGWRRVSWLDFIPRGYREQRRYSLGPSARSGDDVLLTVQYHSTGGNCNQTVVQILRLRQVDLDNPSNESRRAYMQANVRQDAALEHWRTLAELGPLPPERLLEALSLAENEGYWHWGARWWREAVARMPEGTVVSLTAALTRDPLLASTKELLGLATAPKQNTRDP